MKSFQIKRSLKAKGSKYREIRQQQLSSTQHSISMLTWSCSLAVPVAYNDILGYTHHPLQEGLQYSTISTPKLHLPHSHKSQIWKWGNNFPTRWQIYLGDSHCCLSCPWVTLSPA
ncbi:hypothetical protein J6590_009819 [Homalodisca vitripennis]|nr:hypothetical protein J6590_009819 [Homalodisca vitripennis]